MTWLENQKYLQIELSLSVRRYLTGTSDPVQSFKKFGKCPKVHLLSDLKDPMYVAPLFKLAGIYTHFFHMSSSSSSLRVFLSP